MDRKIGALYYLQVKTSWSSHLTPFIIITKHAKREGVASKTQDTTIEFGIIITRDIDERQCRCCVNLEIFKRRSELDTIFKISKPIKRTRFGHCRRRPGPRSPATDARDGGMLSLQENFIAES